MKNVRKIRFLMAICIALAAVLSDKPVIAGPLFPLSISPLVPGTTPAKPAPGKFLVARRDLDGSYFGRSIIYLIEHDGDGTLGLIVNRHSNIRLSEAMPDIEAERAQSHALHYGGPVGLQMLFVLVRGNSVPGAMTHVAEDIYVGSDQRIIEAIMTARLPSNEVRFYLGYSGWAGGQLNSELERGSWHVVAADTNAIFTDEADTLWYQLIEQLEPTGIEVNNQRSPSDLALPGLQDSTIPAQKPTSLFLTATGIDPG